MMSLMAVQAAALAAGDHLAAEAAWDGAAAGNAIRRSRARMERRFWSRCQKKPADGFLRSQRKNRLRRFMSPLRKSCATSTTWATRQIRQTSRPDTIRL